MANYYVTYDKSKGDWRVVKENSKSASRVVSTQKEAEKIAKQLSANSGGGEVRIQNKQNKFRDADTVKPGNDPKNIKDKKY